MGPEIVDTVHVPEFASIQVAEVHTGRLPLGLQLCSILGLALLQQTQTFIKDVAGVLVATGADQRFDDIFLIFRQLEVSSWHGDATIGSDDHIPAMA
jgi:hypothetical protein